MKTAVFPVALHHCYSGERSLTVGHKPYRVLADPILIAVSPPGHAWIEKLPMMGVDWVRDYPIDIMSDSMEVRFTCCNCCL